MNTRRGEILSLLVEHGRLTVDEIAARFGVTGMTVRRDLVVLEEEGVLTRTHGGCVLRMPTVRELPFREKERLHRVEKEAVARAAAARIPDGADLYLDTGTTCAMIAQLLPGFRSNLRIFTNNLPAALDLFGTEEIEVVVPGGILGRSSPDLSGAYGIERIAKLRFDLAVVGADAVDLGNGEFFAADIATAALSEAAQSRAGRTLLCADASKFGKRALASAGRLSGGLTLITDRLPAGIRRKSIESFGAEVVISSPKSGTGGK